jgi:hypothetical protein
MGKLLDYYKAIMEEEYDDSNFENRVAMQKIIFIAEKKGLSIGNYQFFWKERGPYSPYLRIDTVNEVNNRSCSYDARNIFPDFEASVLQGIKGLLSDFSGQEKYDWLELIASLHYIANNEMRISGEKLVCEEVLKRKERLNRADWDLGRAWRISESLIFC